MLQQRVPGDELVVVGKRENSWAQIRLSGADQPCSALDSTRPYKRGIGPRRSLHDVGDVRSGFRAVCRNYRGFGQARHPQRRFESGNCPAHHCCLVLAWAMVFVVGSQGMIGEIDGHTWLFLVLSGLATGASWLCYFRALQVGDVNKVVPVDKSSTVLTMILAFVFLGERVNAFVLAGMVAIGVGTLLMIERRQAPSKPRAAASADPVATGAVARLSNLGVPKRARAERAAAPTWSPQRRQPQPRKRWSPKQPAGWTWLPCTPPGRHVRCAHGYPRQDRHRGRGFHAGHRDPHRGGPHHGVATRVRSGQPARDPQRG